MSTNQSFLGRGWSFPPEFDPHLTQTVKMVEGDEDIRQSIRIILSTIPGQRLMLQSFGCPLQGFVFKPMVESTATLLREAVSSALLNFEPRISVNNVQVDLNTAAGRVDLDVDYTIRKTNIRSNLVYPFCKIEGTLLDVPEVQ